MPIYKIEKKEITTSWIWSEGENAQEAYNNAEHDVDSRWDSDPGVSKLVSIILVAEMYSSQSVDGINYKRKICQ